MVTCLHEDNLHSRGSGNVKDKLLFTKREATAFCITIFQVLCCVTYYTGVFLGWVTQMAKVYAPPLKRNKLTIHVPFTEALSRELVVICPVRPIVILQPSLRRRCQSISFRLDNSNTRDYNYLNNFSSFQITVGQESETDGPRIILVRHRYEI